jgi:hypothetical protein
VGVYLLLLSFPLFEAVDVIALGVPLAFLGVIVIVSAGPSGLHIGADTIRGDLLLLLRSLLELYI